ncbi:lymphocyte antigen 6 family member pge [Neoarius graeffei]|uniref:lymphocyte antigen 6 family member pge n=1 Tax=Neoarius graeffei TaxID=443677 RepID=UPI00298D2F69|nr:lymphocyte antigen 6 family member pge [Neoarius graeffei]
MDQADLRSRTGEALHCYTCMGSTNEDCNRQGSKACPSYSDTCTIIKGNGSGVLKSCSYKSFCSQANSQGDRVAGVKVHCCYSDDCNVMGHGTRLSRGLSYLLVLLPLFWHLLSS